MNRKAELLQRAYEELERVTDETGADEGRTELMEEIEVELRAGE